MIVDKLLNVALLGTAWVLYLLLGMSVVSLAAMAERWFFFRKHRCNPEALGASLCEHLSREDVFGAEEMLARHPSMEAKIVLPALRWIEGGPAALADAIDSEVAKRRKDLERSTTLLGTLGNNAPFVGLFGTVIGVIEAFHQLSGGPNNSAMGNVMSGIAEALVATGVGLFVAIPAVVAYNLVQKSVGDVETNVIAITKQVSALLRTKEREALRTPSHRGLSSRTPAPPVDQTPTPALTDGEDEECDGVSAVEVTAN